MYFGPSLSHEPLSVKDSLFKENVTTHSVDMFSKVPACDSKRPTFDEFSALVANVPKDEVLRAWKNIPEIGYSERYTKEAIQYLSRPVVSPRYDNSFRQIDQKEKPADDNNIDTIRGQLA